MPVPGWAWGRRRNRGASGPARTPRTSVVATPVVAPHQQKTKQFITRPLHRNAVVLLRAYAARGIRSNE